MTTAEYLKYRFALPLRLQPRKPEGGEVSSSPPTREGILVRLRTSDGFEGWGQAMAHNGILTEANETEVAEVALDAARSDAASQQAGLPLCDWLRREAGYESSEDAIQTSPKAIPVNALIFGTTTEEVAEAGKLAVESGISAVKLKVGGGVLQDDIARVQSLREAVGGEVAIRLDANGAWQPQEALQALHSFASFNIEYLEEPTSGLTAIAELASQSPISLAADESIQSLADLPKVSQLGIPVAVIKPSVLGNLKHLLAACQTLVSEGVKVAVSSAMDSSIGIACAAHFAAALNLANTPCGLTTSDWLAADLAPSLPIVEGRILLPYASGLGITPAPEALNNLCAV